MITLSIVSHRQASLVAALLDDLARIASSKVASIVITHNVPEPIPAWPASLSDRITTIVNPTPAGFGANHNAAFRRCTTPFFVVMNPDLHLIDDPFDALVALFEAPPADASASATHGLGMAAPYIVTADGKPEDFTRRLMTPVDVVRRRLAPTARAPSLLPHWLAGMFLFVSSAAFRAVDGFDERFFMYCEDFDLCARMRLDGWDFAVVPGTPVVHAAQRASHRSRRHLYWHLSSLLKMWASSTFWRYRSLLRAERN